LLDKGEKGAVGNEGETDRRTRDCVKPIPMKFRLAPAMKYRRLLAEGAVVRATDPEAMTPRAAYSPI